jgi:DNA-binding MarR family transcriptional regulator
MQQSLPMTGGARDDEDGRIEAVSRECIANKVRLLNRAVTAIYDEALRPHGLKISQMSVLVTVATFGRASPGAVGRRLHMEKSTLSRNVDRMRARGWLDAAATDDERAIELFVTAAGRRLLRKVHAAWSAAQERAVAMLGESGVRGITRTVASLAERRSRGRARND